MYDLHVRLHTQIRFPYGTTVKIAVDGSYLNVWIYPSPPDWKNTIGKIGKTNGLQKILMKISFASLHGDVWARIILNAKSQGQIDIN